MQMASVNIVQNSQSSLIMLLKPFHLLQSFGKKARELQPKVTIHLALSKNINQKNCQILIRTFVSESQRRFYHIGLTKRFSMTIKLFMLQSMSVMSIILISTKKNLKSILVLTFLVVMQKCFVLLIIFCRINA